MVHTNKGSTYTLTLKITTARVVETSVTVNNNSPIQDYVHPDDQTQPTFEMTPGSKPFTKEGKDGQTLRRCQRIAIMGF